MAIEPDCPCVLILHVYRWLCILVAVHLFVDHCLVAVHLGTGLFSVFVVNKLLHIG